MLLKALIVAAAFFVIGFVVGVWWLVRWIIREFNQAFPESKL